jgi:hypothetical protein
VEDGRRLDVVGQGELAHEAGGAQQHAEGDGDGGQIGRGDGEAGEGAEALDVALGETSWVHDGCEYMTTADRSRAGAFRRTLAGRRHRDSTRLIRDRDR